MEGWGRLSAEGQGAGELQGPCSRGEKCEEAESQAAERTVRVLWDGREEKDGGGRSGVSLWILKYIVLGPRWLSELNAAAQA